jgi:hypothetical protein
MSPLFKKLNLGAQSVNEPTMRYDTVGRIFVLILEEPWYRSS